MSVVANFKPLHLLKNAVHKFWSRVSSSKSEWRMARRSPHTTYPQYKFGKWTYGIPKIYQWGEGANLTVGAFCSIADGVQIFLGGEHRTDWVSTYPFPVFWESARAIPGHPGTKGDVVIGNDVWIGHEAVILSGVRIGDGAVVGARAVIRSDVPPYHIAAGNPARVVRARFDEMTINRLLALAWWDWDDEKISRAVRFMTSQDVGEFLDKSERGLF
ncbi:MAG TPA: CatB-related O-acetyltransferase [Nitrospira sp.]|nr:CatB-related O-acetyltransferase [Nitrospira sp.]